MEETFEYVVAMGTFDGIHKGHSSVLKKALEYKNCKKAVITFAEPPKKVLLKKDIPLIISIEQKTEILKLFGFDEIIYLNFNAVKDLSPTEFLCLIFEEFPIKAVCVGYNYRFGKNGEGTAETLRDFCKSEGAECFIAPKQTVNGETVSSSKIREYLQNGNIKKANLMLGHYFSFKANVTNGDKRGRTLGFPTVNQVLPKETVVVKLGVYASYVTVNGKSYKAITNIGTRPTFNKSEILSETNILNFSQDIYGKSVTVELVDYLRNEIRFSSKEELINQINKDKQAAENILK